MLELARGGQWNLLLNVEEVANRLIIRQITVIQVLLTTYGLNAGIIQLIWVRDLALTS